ncbi:MAG: RNA polymerase sigma factor [Gammaproteobacteria bacterium]|nr:RNA polymerase sigma factor [Gammaproteobacteria bacterium]
MQQRLLVALPDLRRFCFSLTGNVHDAEDLLQSTIEKALNNHVNDEVVLLPWLFKVARNRWYDELRYREIRTHENIDDHHAVHPTSDGEEMYQQKLQHEQLNSLVSQLPEQERTLMYLIAKQSLSYAQTAEILDIPVGTVMSRLSRARQKLAELLQDRE